MSANTTLATGTLAIILLGATIALPITFILALFPAIGNFTFAIRYLISLIIAYLTIGVTFLNYQKKYGELMPQ